MHPGNHNVIVLEIIIGILLGIHGITESLGGNKYIVMLIHLKYTQKQLLGKHQVQFVNQIAQLQKQTQMFTLMLLAIIKW